MAESRPCIILVLMLTSHVKRFLISFEKRRMNTRDAAAKCLSSLSHSAVMLLLQRFMGHFAVVTLMQISAVLSEEEAKRGRFMGF